MASVPFTLALLIHVLLFLAASPPATGEQILIDCGATSNSTDQGRVWTGDTAGSLLSGTSSFTATPQGSNLGAPYVTARVSHSSFTYSLPVSGGRYFVRLHFLPASYGDFPSSAAVFDVSCGKFTLLRNFSAADYAGALGIQYIVREYSISASGRLNLTFSPSSNVSVSYAFVNGIELVAMPDIFNDTTKRKQVGPDSSDYPIYPGTALETMYRLNVGGHVLDPNQDSGSLYRLWSDDQPLIAGSGSGITFQKNSTISIEYPTSVPKYIAPSDVYSTARSMAWYNDTNLNYNLSWILTVDPGFYYLVRLHFCELQFTMENQRVFTVYVNNLRAVQDMDVIVYSGRIGVPWYLDFVTVVGEGEKQVGLWVSLNPFTKFRTQYTNVILNGLEVFKINQADNLAGLNPELLSPSLGEPPSRPPSEPRRGVRSGIIAGVLAGALLIGCCMMVVFFFFRGRRQAKDDEREEERDWVPLDAKKPPLPGVNCRRFAFADLAAATGDFDGKHLLGVGGFGEVYRGSIDGGETTVAVKRARARESCASGQGANEFRNEIEMLSKLRHRHLVSLIGYCEEDSEMILVYDYMAGGTLRQHLYGTGKPSLSWRQRLEVCIGAARGLYYLHTGLAHPVIHRDVKSSNILLDGDLVAKVSDFGLSRTSPDTHVSTVVKGSFGYLDPEYFRRQQLTEKSDVYSFGVVLFEVLCARPALAKDLPKEQASLADWALCCHGKGVLEDIVDPHLSGRIAPRCLYRFAETAVKCLSDVGQERPSMGDVLWSLEFALQLQDAAESKGELGPWSGEGKDSEKRISSARTSETTASMRTDDRSIASVGDSIGLTPSIVFSEIMNPSGR